MTRGAEAMSDRPSHSDPNEYYEAQDREIAERLTPETCPHLRIAPQLAAVTSVVAIQVTMFGFKCENCGKQWDVGDAAEALRDRAALQQRVEAGELVKTVFGWIVERAPAFVHGYVMGHHMLDPIVDLPMFFREFPTVDLEGWMAKHAEAMDKMAATIRAAEPKKQFGPLPDGHRPGHG